MCVNIDLGVCCDLTKHHTLDKQTSIVGIRSVKQLGLKAATERLSFIKNIRTVCSHEEDEGTEDVWAEIREPSAPLSFRRIYMDTQDGD